MAVRPEITGKRDLAFSGWIKENLPHPDTGFLVSDVDFILFNYKTKKKAIVEVKTRKSGLKTWQRIFYTTLAELIRSGMKHSDKNKGWQLYGPFFVQFENTFFHDGWCKVNGKKVTESQLIKILSMDYPVSWCEKYGWNENSL